MREDLVKSAVAFLNDPQVANATLAKRIEFLESKQLTPQEIEEALGQAKNGTTTTSSSSSTVENVPTSPRPYYAPPPPPQTLPPPLPSRDWKDYFVMATVSAGMAYGLYEVTRRYILPLILPPTPSSLEADKDALEAEFARAEGLLEQLQKDTEEIKKAEQERKEEFSLVLKEAQEAIDYVKVQAQQRETDMKLIKTHVESIKDSLPKALEKHRDQQDRALLELQEELKSLKQLVSNRIKSGGAPPPASAVPSYGASSSAAAATTTTTTKKPDTSSITPTQIPSQLVAPGTSNGAPSATPSPSLTPRPGIPAWQLAAGSKSTETATETSTN
jgi:peroxin-14